MNRIYSNKIAFSAVMAALAVAFLLLSALIPGMRLSFCALAGLPVAAMVLRCGRVAAATGYAAAGIVALLFLPVKAPVVVFLALFGIYPVLKSLFETPRLHIALSYSLKLLYFAFSVASMILLASLLGLFESESLQVFGRIIPLEDIILPAAGVSLVFLLAYDYALTVLIGMYIRRFQK